MAIDRRRFLRGSAAHAALLGAGLAGCGRHPGADASGDEGVAFAHGVASGDPLVDRVMLWTRVSPPADRAGESIAVRWWLATDEGGRNVVARGEASALAERDFTVKVDARGLRAGHRYFYGFEAEGVRSPVGRTRTLPEESVDRVRLAFASCANYPHGFFNAYAAIAARDDLDVVLHLGDYIYEYGDGEYGGGADLGRFPDPRHEAITLEDYRRRHALYKRDADLQAAHAAHPWITVWDDHETANNSWRDGAENHDPVREGSWSQRRLAAVRAYYEWLPIRELPTGIYRRFRFGGLVDLLMLDTRLHGRDEQGPRDPAVAGDPERTLLGEDQARWLADALVASQRSGARWRVIGQQVMVSPVSVDGRDFNPDSWSGYAAERSRLLDLIARERIDNVVFLTGDVHSAWVFDVPPPEGSSPAYDGETGAGARAVEFVTPAVSSRPLGRFPQIADYYADIQSVTPHLAYVNLDENGFVLLDLTADRALAQYVFTAADQTRSSEVRCGPAFAARAGTNHVEPADAALCGDVTGRATPPTAGSAARTDAGRPVPAAIAAPPTDSAPVEITGWPLDMEDGVS